MSHMRVLPLAAFLMVPWFGCSGDEGNEASPGGGGGKAGASGGRSADAASDTGVSGSGGQSHGDSGTGSHRPVADGGSDSARGAAQGDAAATDGGAGTSDGGGVQGGTGGAGTGGSEPVDAGVEAGNSAGGTEDGGAVEPNRPPSQGSVDGYPMWPMPLSGTYAIGTHTVVDERTGLHWQRGVSDPLALAEAIAYCEDLELAGHADWRLPSRIELVSIVNFNAYDPAINTTAFPDTPSESFHSSSPKAGQPEFVWGVNFLNGATNSAGSTARARCVR